MSIVSFPENLWRIDVTAEDLQINLVRSFMGKQRVLKKMSIPDAAALPQALGKSSNRAFLNLQRDQGVVRQLQLPVDVKRDLKSALALQIEAISAWPEQDVYWDYIVDKAQDNPKLLMITVVIIPKAVLDPWLQTFEAARIPLAGASIAGFDVNVIPVKQRGGSARVHVVASYVLVACIAIVGLALLLREPYQQKVYASQIQHEIDGLEPQVKQLVKQEAEWSTLSKRYQLMLKHLKSRDANLDALKTLSTVLPPDTFLLNYRYQNETVTISGVSASALVVQSALENSPVFQGVQFSAPITRDPSGKDRFSMTMTIEARP
jgi:general secretion pathway protein L